MMPSARLIVPTLSLWFALSACGGGAGSATDEEILALRSARDAPALVRLLGSSDPTARARSAFALGSVQAQAAAPALIALLEDEEAAVRAEAAFALGQLPQTSGEIENALLEAAAAEPDPLARVRVIEALGKVGREAAAEWLAALPTADPAGAEATLALARTVARGVALRGAVDALLDRITDPDDAVRERAAWGLANALIETTWSARRGEVYAALDGYDRSDPAAVQLLQALLRVPDPAGKERAREWLRESPDWRARAAAVEALTAAQAPDDRRALLNALDDPSPHVSRAAAWGLLGSTLEEGELDRVAAWIRANPERTAMGSILMRTFVEQGRGDVAVAWLAGLPHDDPGAWPAAVDAVSRVPGEGATRALAAAARSSVAAVSAAARRALAIRWATEREGPDLQPLYYDAFAGALRDRDPALLSALPRLLSDPAFRALGSDSLVAEARAAAETPEPLPVQPDPRLLRELGSRPRLVLETERGTIVVEMWSDEAPLTVQTVARLAREGRYDGTPFHRVLPNFMAQGGDVARGDGLGDPGFRVPSEFTHLTYERGTVGMARTDKDTENSQFFLTLSLQPHLDGSYSAFGRIVEGLEALDGIVEGDRILRARVETGS